MSTPTLTPEVTWAQRSSDSDPERNYIYLTLMTPDVPKSSMKLQLTSNGLTYDGYSETKKTNYHLGLELWGEIDVENSKTHHSGRDVELVLRKKELKEEYWPRLLKTDKKQHYLRTDFDKWVDEDEQNGEEAEGDAGPSMRGMPDFGGGEGGLGGLDFSKLAAGGGGMPDLSALAGGAGGMPDLSALGGAAGGDEGEDDIPDLEGEKAEGEEGEGEGEAKAGSGAKIEEVA